MNDEDTLGTSGAFTKTSYDESYGKAMREAAKRKKKEKYEGAGSGIGAIAGTIGAIITGNPALIGTGLKLGKTVGSLASGNGSLEDLEEGVGQVAGAVGSMDGEIPDFESMSDNELMSTLKKNKSLLDTDEFKRYAINRKTPLPAFAWGRD